MSDNPLFARDSSLMRPQSLNRGESCADLAIPLIAAGGCRAVSAGVLARQSGVTPAAVLKWFGSTAQMWEAVADAIGRRWCSYLQSSSRLRSGSGSAVPWTSLDLDPAMSLFLPLNDDEVEWTRVWLSMLELGRHHELVGKRIAVWEAQELDVLYRTTMCRDVPTLTATMVIVRGMRHMAASTEQPLDLSTMHDWLRRHVHATYVVHGVPEPASDDDVLASSRRYAYSRG